jgi:hypothetical protein
MFYKKEFKEENSSLFTYAAITISSNYTEAFIQDHDGIIYL